MIVAAAIVTVLLIAHAVRLHMHLHEARTCLVIGIVAVSDGVTGRDIVHLTAGIVPRGVVYVILASLERGGRIYSKPDDAILTPVGHVVRRRYWAHRQ